MLLHNYQRPQSYKHIAYYVVLGTDNNTLNNTILM